MEPRQCAGADGTVPSQPVAPVAAAAAPHVVHAPPAGPPPPPLALAPPALPPPPAAPVVPDAAAVSALMAALANATTEATRARQAFAAQGAQLLAQGAQLLAALAAQREAVPSPGAARVSPADVGRLPVASVPLPLRDLFRALCSRSGAVAPARAKAADVLLLADLSSGRGFGGNYAALLVLATVVARPYPSNVDGLQHSTGAETLEACPHVVTLFYVRARSFASIMISRRGSALEEGTDLCHLARHFWLRPTPQHAQELLVAACRVLQP